MFSMHAELVQLEVYYNKCHQHFTACTKICLFIDSLLTVYPQICLAHIIPHLLISFSNKKKLNLWPLEIQRNSPLFAWWQNFIIL